MTEERSSGRKQIILAMSLVAIAMFTTMLAVLSPTVRGATRVMKAGWQRGDAGILIPTALCLLVLIVAAILSFTMAKRGVDEGHVSATSTSFTTNNVFAGVLGGLFMGGALLWVLVAINWVR